MLHHPDIAKGTLNIASYVISKKERKERDAAFCGVFRGIPGIGSSARHKGLTIPQVSEISSAIIHARSLSRVANVIPDPTELGSSFTPSPRSARIRRADCQEGRSYRRWIPVRAQRKMYTAFK